MGGARMVQPRMSVYEKALLHRQHAEPAARVYRERRRLDFGGLVRSRTQGYHRSAADADRAMTERKAASSFVVRDTAGILGRQYGARTTPHLYVIDPEGVLRYAGAIDNKPSPSPSDVPGAQNYQKLALDAGLAGKPIAIATTQPYGCDVKY